MRITCPACAAAYDVPDARIAPNRPVRCARCGTDWTPLAGAPAPVLPIATGMHPQQTPSQPAPAPVLDAPAPDASAMTAAALLARAIPPKMTEEEAARLAPRRRSWGLAAAWAASISLLLLGAAAAVHWRADVMAAWPPSERLYAALGLLRDAPRQ